MTTLTTRFPAWYEKLRSDAEKEYERLDWPTRKDENWRFGSYKKGNLADAQIVHGGQAEGLPEPALTDALRFVFCNNELIATEGEIPEGIVAGPLEDVLRDYGDCIEGILPPLQGKLGSPKLAALHRAKSEGGIALNISIACEKPIEIVHLVSGEGVTTLPYTLIVGMSGGKATVLERFVSANESDAATVVSVSDLIAMDKSELRYLVSQELNEQSQFIRLADSKLGKNTRTKTGSIHIGASWAREETYSTVDGAESNSEILSVAIPTTGQEYDQRTFQHHGAPHTGSDLLFKNTLFGKGKTVFSGLIFVDEGAHYTDAYQTCRNLFMSDEAEANSMPGLEINADQVKCSHGSTSSRVSDEEIYYLCSRGINPASARRMIAQGFSAEVVEKFEDEALEAFAIGRIEAKFARVS
ncbi:SufB/SufD family protein [Roseibacillus ishigakijimensis]|uniref:SufD family Fe-S cluster assembly protein n=1 Tax=Roseibacillus ishigakijimensis TaxID=454146 RepID=A0A934RQM0_9BACT|nr:SufD family Fe-S cluster assembly protein [Roseibacillus ishigakijimensis]MBK1833289.1 SufD family Fe-S cluster assembly protein [Roseibacillus ishigakijimensis]